MFSSSLAIFIVLLFNDLNRQDLKQNFQMYKARIPTGKGGKTMAIIQMDGPYGAPAEHIFEYPVAILIAAGKITGKSHLFCLN